MLNRRDFFRRATAAAVGALTLDPERLLWVPGQRAYFDIVSPEPIRLIHPAVWYEFVSGGTKYRWAMKPVGEIIEGGWSPERFTFTVESATHPRA